MKQKSILIIMLILCAHTSMNAYSRDYMDMKPIILEEKNAPDYTNAQGETIKMLLKAHDTAGQYTMFSDTFKDTTAVPLHEHQWHDEAFYVVRGSYEIVNGNPDEIEIVSAGTVVFAPRGTLHKWTAVEPDSKFLVVYTPGGWDHFREAWENVDAEKKKDEAFVKEFLESYDEYYK